MRKIFVLTEDQWLNELHGPSVLDLFNNLASLGFQVKILFPSTRKILMHKGHLSITSIKIRNIIPLFTNISLFLRAWRIMLEQRTDILIFSFKMFPIFLLAKIFLKCKGFMLILSRPLEDKEFKLFRISLIIGRFIIDIFTAISPMEVSEFSRLGNISKQKIVVLPSPLGGQFKEFNLKSSPNTDKLRLELGLNRLVGKKVLLHHGVLHDMRGILEFLRIFSAAFKDDKDITLLLVGDGSAKKSIKEFILKNKVSNIVLSDPVPYSKIRKVILACDMGVVLFPDKPARKLYRYQCPTKIIEFLALGKPVIASDLPGIKWIAKDSPSVIFLKLLNESSLREAFYKILTEKKKNGMKTAPSRQKIINRFLSSTIARKLSRIIDSV